MIIKPKYKGYICTTAHPAGCYKNVEDMVLDAVKINEDKKQKPRNVIVVGASSGYGLASRIISAFAYQAKTIGISYERGSSERRTATPGFYNNRAFDAFADEYQIPHKTINGDAFSDETKDLVIATGKELFGDEKIDLLIYSLAAPRRVHPVTGEVYTSVIKPIGDVFSRKTVDFHNGEVKDITIMPATEDEIQSTIQVMGGEDWYMWINRLMEENLLADDFITTAYSYIGPPITYPIYRDGTIGKAKDDLLRFCGKINDVLKQTHGKAYISVNKALVTQASSAIPVVPLYIALLYKVMKDRGIHEGCYEQIKRLFTDNLYAGKEMLRDDQGRIRMDDLEMRSDVQDEINRVWPALDSQNLEELTDISGYRNEFFSLFGFARNDVDYEEDVMDF